MCDYRWDLDWWMNLLTTCTHHSELQIFTALSLISTLYQSLHAKSSPACSVFTSRCLVTALNNGDSSASVLTSLLFGEYQTTELSTVIQRHLFSAPLAELNSQLTGSLGRPRCLAYNTFARTQYLYCCRGVFTAPLLGSGPRATMEVQYC
jgi:hypothetical protein